MGKYRKALMRVMFVLCFMFTIFIGKSNVFAYETTPYNTYSRTGYHLENAPGFPQTCTHAADNVDRNYAEIHTGAQGLNLSDHQIISGLYSSSPTNLGWSGWSKSYRSGFSAVNPYAYRIDVTGCVNLGAATLCEPYYHQDAPGVVHQGYAYYQWDFVWCSTVSAWVNIGNHHSWYGIDDGRVGVVQYAKNSFSHVAYLYNIVPNTYNVSLDRTGGSSGGGSFNVQYDSNLNYGVGWAKPTKSGCTFKGWYDSVDSSGNGTGTMVYDENGSCNNSSGYWSSNNWCKDLGVHGSSITLYAKWENNASPPTPKYTVTCKDHHADGTVTERTKVVDSGTSVGGCSTFGTACKTGEEYDRDDGWHNITGDTTIHIYYKLKKYTVTCEDHHADGTVTERTKSIDHGTDVGGWSTFGTACKTGEEYDHDDGWHRAITGNTTVHIYYKLKKYTVTCKDHHADGTVATRTKSIDHGTDVGGYSTFGTACKTGEEYDHDDGWHNITGNTTIHIYYKYKTYTMTVYHKRYLPNSGSWEHFATTTHTAGYSSKFYPPYSKTPTGYHNHSRDWNSGWTVTGNGAFNVYYYPNSYNQTIHYYTYNASGVYTSPAHTWVKQGSKSWSQLYSTWFDAYTKRASWGNINGYHWWSINSNGWTVAGEGSTNSHYYPNKYRLNVDLNKGSGSTTPSGTSGNFDMEYGTNINLGTPTMTGYTFGGWSIAEHNSTGHSLSSNTFTMGYNKSYPHQSYTSGSTVKIKAKWNANSYNLIYDLNDSTGSTSAQFGAYHPNTVKFDTEFIVSNPSRAGYTFAGWNITGMDNSTHYYGAHRTTERYIDNTSETVFRNLNSSNKAVVTFKAVWIPNTYTIHFDGNGAAGGNVDDITVRYDENMTLPANGYVLDRNTFVGWTHDCTAHVGTYAEGQEMLSSVIIDAAGMTTQNSAVITLYCAWDPAPNITVSDKTFSLDEARNGLITEERLFEGAYAMDEILDSEILPGTHLLENGSCNSFTITNFSEDEFTQFTDSGSATITYQVVDSVGNITEETITIFIVDNTPKEAQSGEGTYHVRFISDKYYDKTEVEGGLPEDSIWRKRPEYAEILNEIMGKY